MNATLQIETLTSWSEPKEISTRLGKKLLRKGPATESFWDAWRAGKDALKAAGVSCGKDARTGAWEACWWLPLDASTIEKQEVAVEASRQAEAPADFAIPAPDGLDYLPFQKAGILRMMQIFGLALPMGLGNNKSNAKRNIPAQTAGGARPSSCRTDSRMSGSWEDSGSAEASCKAVKDKRSRPGMEGNGFKSDSGCDEKPSNPSPSFGRIETGKAKAWSQLQGRERVSTSTESDRAGVEAEASGIHHGVSDQNQGSRDGIECSDRLQGGFRPPDKEGGGGSGRANSQEQSESSQGQEEDRSAQRAGVDRSESQTLKMKGAPSVTGNGVLLADEMGL